MPVPRSRNRALPLLALVALLICGGVVLWSNTPATPAPVTTRPVLLDVVDGPQRTERVQIDATLYLPARTPAPAVIVAHGFGGNKDSVATDATELADRGFVVLAYSARGFGRSTGQIALNARDYEIADAEQLVSWLSRQPEVALDGPGDPRVGVTGGSYGGALSLMLAGVDRRVDAIAPLITWNDLAQALLPNAATRDAAVPGSPAGGGGADNGVFKRAWAGMFFSSGLGPASTGGGGPGPEAPEPGVPSTGTSAPADTAAPPQGGERGAPNLAALGQGPATCGRFRPEVCAAYTEVATTGKASQQTIDLLRRSSPVSVADKITVPSLIVQGERDTLFGLDQSDANARQIAGAGGKVKTIWYAGGHDGGGPGPLLRGQIADWFGFHLSGQGTDPGTGFSYAVQGAFRTGGGASVREVVSPGYPGLHGQNAVRRDRFELIGTAQPVINPAGGNPAAVSGFPGLSDRIGGASALSSGLSIDIPGQSAIFTTRPLAEQVLVAGSANVRLRLRSIPGQPATGEAVLFGKLYDVGPDGRRTLAGGAVAPIRVTGLPADGSPVEVTAALPGVVRPIEAGHRMQVVFATTDQSFAGAAEPATHLVEVDPTLSVPIVPGTRSSSPAPVGALIGIGVVLAVAVAAALLARFRRRRADDVDQSLVDTPLVISGLRKEYKGGLTAVDGLSFSVERGQVLGLLGPNGAGKTTTLRMLMGLVQPTAGEIRVFGHRVHSGAPVLSRIGSFVEGSGFLPHLSGTANLRLYWAATGRAAEEARFDEALEIAGLGKAVRRKVGTYSQGMRQRLAIAQAMLGLPDLLVLDEPANGLDPPQIHQMRDVLRRYAATGRTVVVSSHLLAEVEQTCSHVVVMHRGRLVASGEVAEIVAGGGAASFRVDRPSTAVNTLRTLEGVGEVSAEGEFVSAELGPLPRAVAVAALVQAGIAVEQAGPRRRLEDAFLQLVGEESVQ
ncbi:alpha/beta fold hydrolase [Allokutzneria sp. A3M-2-11 16]|uniref:alpha/beta fold hydrolase n=1 Tax=Allokutzneria sp. A3M-2-11 16 TaxID=2962043 RepID=UPI0020B855B6|nr:alpha/beta fold hydrolase [Allokutzneria sp. A3M-2-11 16]MCP3802476.1 alpha/beta fold hydrolase [Allokutzneria sp. A3M-2-11 16]